MNRQELGRLGEDRACAFLSGLGFEITERNYRSRWGEIDIIARGGGVIVFAEVKLRAENAPVSGLEAVNVSKMKKIVKTASVWLAEHPAALPARFDVIEVKTGRVRGGDTVITGVIHIPSAFGAEVCDEVF